MTRPSPLQNRVLPTGEIVAHPARGTLTGNRGILHVADGVMGTARWRHKAWICCTLDWQGRRRAVMTGRNWTELFFLDEAVALAAGHRPCGYCRRAAFTAFRDAFAGANGCAPRAPVIDSILHAARVTLRARDTQTHSAPAGGLPEGAFVWHEAQPHLVTGAGLHTFTMTGYAAPVRLKGHERVRVLTPAPTVAALRAGYRPQLHPTATA